MTLHRRTLHWFRRLGIAPAIPHYMMKNVLIGKNAAGKAAESGRRSGVRRFTVYFA
jgi:hypothetical protein